MSAYKVDSTNFKAIAETTGTIQNTDTVDAVEISDDPSTNGGILLHPHDRYSFNGAQIYARAVNTDRILEVHVVPFEETKKGGGSGGGSGSPGPAGRAATVDIGTVTTGATGTSASVTNSGTTSDAVFDFVIPRGDKGEKGDKGDIGQGIAAGGTPGQILKKKSATDYDTEWTDSDTYDDTAIKTELAKKIEKITVNGTEQTVTDKTVVITVMTNTVDNLVNYYKKTETYTQAEVDALISAIVTLDIKAVDALPTSNISTTTIYLVPSANPQTQNVKNEYIYINGAWEMIGSTAIDLSGYVTTAALNTALSAYVTGTNLATILNGYITITAMNTALSSKANSTDLAAIATSGSYDDLSDKPTIPAAYDDTALSERVSDIEDVIPSTASTTNLLVTADYIPDTSGYKTAFIGTTAQWQALSATDKAKYQIVNLTDDYANGAPVIVDTVTEGDMNPVTSNAVYKISINVKQVRVAASSMTLASTTYGGWTCARIADFYTLCGLTSNQTIINVAADNNSGSTDTPILIRDASASNAKPYNILGVSTPQSSVLDASSGYVEFKVFYVNVNIGAGV